MNSKKTKKKFCIVAKVSTTHFVKYRTNDIDNVIKFIINKYGEIFYANIFSNSGINENKLMFTYGKHKGLQPAY